MLRMCKMVQNGKQRLKKLKQLNSETKTDKVDNWFETIQNLFVDKVPRQRQIYIIILII